MTARTMDLLSKQRAPWLAVVLLLAAAACARRTDDWRADLADDDAFTRGLAAITLVEIDPSSSMDVIPEVCAAIEATNSTLHQPARRALARIAHHASTELVTLLSTESSRWARAAISDALVAAGAASRPALIAALDSNTTERPREVGRVLARQGTEGCAALARVLRDSVDVRARATAAVVFLDFDGDARVALPELLHALAHDRANIAGLAARAAARIDPHSDEVEKAIRTAHGNRPELRRETGEALAYLLLERSERGPLQSIEMSLRTLGEDAVGPSIEALNDSRPRVSSTASRVLAVRMFDHTLGFKPAESWTATNRAPLSRRVEALSFDEFSTRAHFALALGAAGARSIPLLPLLAASVLDRDRRLSTASGLAILAIVVDLVVRAALLEISR